MLEKATDMSQVKANLLNLSRFMPDEDETTYDLARYLAARLNPELVPIGFNMMLELVFYDLHKGKSGFDHIPLPHSLTGQPPIVYVLMKMQLPKIISCVCEKEFADEVLKIMSDIRNQCS